MFVFIYESTSVLNNVLEHVVQSRVTNFSPRDHGTIHISVIRKVLLGKNCTFESGPGVLLAT